MIMTQIFRHCQFLELSLQKSVDYEHWIREHKRTASSVNLVKESNTELFASFAFRKFFFLFLNSSHLFHSLGWVGNSFLPKKTMKQYHSRCFCESMVYLKRVYIVVIATLVIPRGKWELRRNIFRTMRVQNTKKEKRCESLLNFCDHHL